MTGGLVRASVEELARLRAHPSELPEFLDCGAWAPPNREVRPRGIFGWLLRLTPVKIYENDKDAVPPPGVDGGALRPNIDLDKAWEPLNFLLTGTAMEGDEPACYLARGGEELAGDDLDEEQTGYSSIRALTLEQVAAFDRHLSSLTVDELRRRFDVNRMVELRIYSKPRGTKTAMDDDERLAHVIEAFEDLRKFVRETAASGAGAIAYLT
jgi:hypothetical protein